MTRLLKLEGHQVRERLFIVGGDIADCERKLERLKRNGTSHGFEPVLIATGIFRPDDELDNA
jgi:hypothetical protein